MRANEPATDQRPPFTINGQHAIIVPGERCPRCDNLVVIRTGSNRRQCASWTCEMRSFLASPEEVTA